MQTATAGEGLIALMRMRPAAALRAGLICFKWLDAQAETSSTSELATLLGLRSCKGIDGPEISRD